MDHMKRTRLWKLIMTSGAIAVALGAFGAHGLKEYLSDIQWDNFQTASRYHFIHTLAAAMALLLPIEKTTRVFQRAPWLFLMGIMLFSGSIYLLACRDLIPFSVSWLGPVTPIGGLILIAGWLSLLFIKTDKG